MTKRILVAAAFVAGMACGGLVRAGLGLTQSEEVTQAIEAGIAAGLPRSWAYRVAWCESRYQPSATNRWSGAAGVYQFLPSTWRSTPQGRAGLSPYDPYANALAAAWLYRTAGPRQWSCR